MFYFSSKIFQVNTLKSEVSAEFEEIFDTITSNNNVRAAVLISKKPTSFIAGADIKLVLQTSNSLTFPLSYEFFTGGSLFTS